MKRNKQTPLFLINVNGKSSIIKEYIIEVTSEFVNISCTPLNRKAFRIALKKMNMNELSKKQGSQLQYEDKKLKERANRKSTKESRKRSRISKRTKVLVPANIVSPFYAK